MSYILQHTTLGWCRLDIAALVVLFGVCIYAYCRISKMKEQAAQLEKRLKDAGLE